MRALREAGRFAGILQPLPDLEDGRPDTSLNVCEDIGRPQALGDVFARDQFPSTFEQ